MKLFFLFSCLIGIQKLNVLDITDWDKEEVWSTLGFISHHLRVTPDQTLRRRVEIYYRNLRLAKAAKKELHIRIYFIFHASLNIDTKQSYIAARTYIK